MSDTKKRPFGGAFWYSRGMDKPIRVMAFGTFDLLHEGHRAYLAQAASLGDELLVCVAADQAVEWVKGRKPKQSEDERLAATLEVPGITRAFIGEPMHSRDDYLRPLRQYQPDVVCLGYDQALEVSEWLNEAVQDLPKVPRIVRANAYKPEVFKTSLLRAE